MFKISKKCETCVNYNHTILLTAKKKYERSFMKDYNFDEYFDRFPIAMAYVPIQHMSHIYENLNEALKIGTLFPELTKPFVGRRNKS